jgi:hypothetical protein
LRCISQVESSSNEGESSREVKFFKLKALESNRFFAPSHHPRSCSLRLSCSESSLQMLGKCSYDAFRYLLGPTSQDLNECDSSSRVESISKWVQVESTLPNLQADALQSPKNHGAQAIESVQVWAPEELKKKGNRRSPLSFLLHQAHSTLSKITLSFH